ncbi:hypothetical protein ARMGADRAFT_1038231 [Armillaria gallica]|uniref:F-box domain-containing protein n=1 Tax=Armillaria gallica TaxID=47427 RepID=A0A2H3D1P2_ARMGA|nr:hypothetical protein ARMGADRAFT_1038231 [Armillaria gallica]
MTLTFSPDFRYKLARVLHFIKSINYVPKVQVDFKDLSFTPQDGETMSDVYDTFSNFCGGLTMLDCIGWTLSHDVEAFEQLLSSSTANFAPVPFMFLYTVIILVQARKMTDWVVHSLNSSPIHVVITDCDMEAMLAEITMPWLISFTGIYTSDTSEVSVDMVEFLRRHPSLTAFFLSAQSIKPRDMEWVHSALWPLPILQTMSASLDVLNVLLSKPLLFPVLQEISIQGPVRDIHQGTWEEHFILLFSILILIGCIPGVSTLKLPFLNHFNGDAWNTFLFPPHRPEAFLTNVKKLVFYGTSVFMRPDAQEPFDLICTISYFPVVEEVDIEDRSFLGSRDEDQWLTDFCSACPMVTCLVMTSKEYHFA